MELEWVVKELWNNRRNSPSRLERKEYVSELKFLSNSKMTLPYVYMRTVYSDLVPWLCSQTDLLASDWRLRSERRN